MALAAIRCGTRSFVRSLSSYDDIIKFKSITTVSFLLQQAQLADSPSLSPPPEQSNTPFPPNPASGSPLYNQKLRKFYPQPSSNPILPKKTKSPKSKGIVTDSHNIYDVLLYSDHIRTVVTHDPQQLAAWISETEALHHNHHIIVGLDLEWRPSFIKNQKQNPIAIIQLCVDRRCIIFQVLKYGAVFNTIGIPIELEQFLGNESYTFVGVGIRTDFKKLKRGFRVLVGDVETLQRDYGVGDLGKLAAKAYQDDQLKSAGLKKLANLVLGTDMEKPKRVSMSNWDNHCLAPEQVQYACMDAFVSSEIGKRLSAFI